MKNKAFTLTELLGVIVILGILALVTFPNIASHIGKAKKELKEGTKILIIDAAKDYYEDNKNDYDQLEGMTYCIDIDTLTNNNYLNKKIKDENLNDIDTSEKVKLIYHNNNFEYQVTDTCNNALTRNNIEVPLVTTGDGLYKSETEPGRLIYRGTDPDNRILLKEDGTNNTLYRIVSYEKDGTIKVVRDEKLFNKEWDEGIARQNTASGYYCKSDKGCNVWGSGSNTLYNGSPLGDNFHYIYYKNNTTTLSNGVSGKVETESTLNKYLNDGSWTGLSNLESYIDTHSWNVGGVYYTSGDKGIIKEKEEERQLNWLGKVGLLNITEYVEASLNPTCTSARGNYGPASGSPCKTENWTMYNKTYNQWSLSPVSNNRDLVWIVDSTGSFNYYASNAYGVCPSFYLKPSISLTGQGSEENPYIIQGEA